MAEFFKSLFVSYVKKNSINKKVHKNIKLNMQNFTNTVFASVLNKLRIPSYRMDFLGNLTIIVHSHRHSTSLMELSTSSKESDDH